MESAIGDIVVWVLVGFVVLAVLTFLANRK